MKILEVDNIHTYYGDSHVIQGLSLYVNRGEAVSIIGRNGVGKTTTLRSIMGLTPPKRGTIKINGEDSTKWPPNKVVVKGGVASPFKVVLSSASLGEDLSRGNMWSILAAFPLRLRLFWSSGMFLKS